MTDIEHFHYFPTSIYTVTDDSFLDDVRSVSRKALDEIYRIESLDTLYPVCMSGSLLGDPKMEKFCEKVGTTGWRILQSQGYDMTNMAVRFTELWAQEHHKTSSMEYHPPLGCHLVGFYFLDVPENGPYAMLHDPRQAKAMLDLPETDPAVISSASKYASFRPQSGQLVFANSWLPHSFTRNPSDDPFHFIHFNLVAQQNSQNPNLGIA